jgi:hypothetical protein
MERSTAKSWKSKQKRGADLELPSGNVALVKPLKPEAFLQGGLIPDPLGQLVSKAINSKKGLPPTAMKDIADDPAKLAAAMEMFDRVLTYVVVEPEVRMPPLCVVDVDGEPCGKVATDAVHFDTHKSGHHRCEEAEREEDVLYADIVDMEDKMFIFNWCVGGTKDIASFRDELASNVGAVSADQALQGKTKQDVGS